MIQTCPTCNDNTKEHGIVFRPGIAECMFCEALRDEVERVIRQRMEPRIDSIVQDTVRRLARAHRSADKAIGKLHEFTFIDHAPCSPAVALVEAVNVCAARWQVDPQDVLKKDRHAVISRPRHVTFWICRKMGFGLSDIAKLAKRDHSTILASVHVVEALCKQMPEFKVMCLEALEKVRKACLAMVKPVKARAPMKLLKRLA